MTKLLNACGDPLKRSRIAHEEVDHQLNSLFKDPVVNKHVSCKKGCTACCHTQVSVTEEEALLLAKKIQSGTQVNFDRLEKQAVAQNSAKDWYQIPFEDRKCVFLGADGLCQVYEDRPSVCRTNYVVSDPTFCSTEDGQVKPVNLLKTLKADMAVAAQFKSSRSSGALPHMLVKALSKRLAVFKSKDLG